MAANLQGLLSAFAAQVQHGPGAAYYAQNDYDNAVEAFKKTGASGVADVGPGIDESTSGKSAAVTQQAWTVNGQLGQINSGAYNGTAATKGDADNALAALQQMLALYQQGYAMTGASAAPSATSDSKPGTWAPPTSAAPPTAAASSSGSLTPIIGGALVGAAVIGVALGTLPAAIGGAIAGTIIGTLLRKKGA